MTNETEVEVTRVYERGGYRINHPRKAGLSLEQRAFQMWAVHPDDLKAMGMSREQFFLAHLETVLASRATDTALAEELRALDANATPGPWNHLGYCGQDGNIHGPRQNPIARLSSGVTSTETGHTCYANAALIVALKNNLPRILAVLEGKRT